LPDLSNRVLSFTDVSPKLVKLIQRFVTFSEHTC